MKIGSYVGMSVEPNYDSGIFQRGKRKILLCAKGRVGILDISRLDWFNRRDRFTPFVMSDLPICKLIVSNMNARKRLPSPHSMCVYKQ